MQKKATICPRWEFRPQTPFYFRRLRAQPCQYALKLKKIRKLGPPPFKNPAYATDRHHGIFEFLLQCNQFDYLLEQGQTLQSVFKADVEGQERRNCDSGSHIRLMPICSIFQSSVLAVYAVYIAAYKKAKGFGLLITLCLSNMFLLDVCRSQKRTDEFSPFFSIRKHYLFLVF